MLLDQTQQLPDLPVGQLELLDHGSEGLPGEHAVLLSLRDQGLDLLELDDRRLPERLPRRSPRRRH